MRPLLLVLLACTPGCTHQFLQQNTLRTASTLPRLQSQQVMDNLAAVCANPEANPWHVTLSSGLIQATDQGGGGVTAMLQSGVFPSLTPGLSGQRSLSSQWAVGPVIDGEQTELLQLVYKKALYPADPDLDVEIKKQIVDLCVRFTLLPSKDTLRDILHQPKPASAIRKICAALEKENGQWAYLLGVADANMGAGKNKDNFELAVRKKEIQDAIDLRIDQIKLLQHFAKAPRAKKAESAEPAANAPQLKPTKQNRDQTEDDPNIPHGVKAAVSPRQRAMQTKQASTTSDTTLLILTALQTYSPTGYLPTTDLMWESTRNPAFVDQAEDQIANLEKLLDPEEGFGSPWLHHSPCKKDVPKCACAVGHAKICGQDCYVWVMPENFGTLQRFTRIIMTLTANAQQETPQNSPTVTPSSLRR